jgi:hypothetical protein
MMRMTLTRMRKRMKLPRRRRSCSFWLKNVNKPRLLRLRVLQLLRSNKLRKPSKLLLLPSLSQLQR